MGDGALDTESTKISADGQDTEETQVPSSQTIRFNCPHCAVQIEVSAEKSGIESRCPECTQRVVIPPSDYVEPETGRVRGMVDGVFPHGTSTGLTISAFMAEKDMTAQPVELLSHEATLKEGEVAPQREPEPPKHDYLETERHRHYEIGDIVARGGMGAIIAARDTNIRRQVAMKVMLEKRKVGSNELLRFIQEAQITGQLEHPNIVPVHELAVDSSGHVFYTMKFLRGTTLKAIVKAIRNGKNETIEKYPLNTLINIYLKLCDAVAFAHSRGVVHRDLKPENVMVGDYGEVMVVDWGLAKVMGMELVPVPTEDEDKTPDWASEGIESVRDEQESLKTMKGTILGTPSFMAPEQAHGNTEEIGPKSDIYALGGILYNLLTLHLPVESKGMNDLLVKLVSGKLIPPQEWNPDGAKVAAEADDKKTVLHHLPGQRIPDGLAAVAMKALATKADDRYDDVQGLQREIESWQAGFATQAENASLLRQLKLLVSRHKREFMLAGVAVLVLVCTVAVFMIGLKRSRDEAVAARVAEAEQRKRAEEEEQKAVAEREKAERELYYANIQYADDCIFGEPARPAVAQRTLERCGEKLRHFEWHFLWSRLQNMGSIQDISGWREPHSWRSRVAITRDCRTIYLAAHRKSDSTESAIFRFKLKDGTWEKSVHPCTGVKGVYDLKLSTGEKYVAVMGLDCAVYDAVTMEEVKRFPKPVANRIALVDDRTERIYLNPTTLGGKERFVTSFDLRSKKPRATEYVQEKYYTLPPSGNPTPHLIFHSYRREHKKEAIFCDQNGKKLFTLKDENWGRRYAVTESPDASVIIAASDQFVDLYDGKTRRKVRRFKFAEGFTLGYALAASPGIVVLNPGNSLLFVTRSSQSAKTLVYDVATGELIKTFPFRLTKIRFSPNDKLMCGADRNMLRLFDPDSGELIRTFQGHDGDITEFRFTPDSNRIVSVSSSRILESRIELPLPEQRGAFDAIGRLMQYENGQLIAVQAEEFKAGHIHTARTNHVYPDQARMRFATYDAANIKVWDRRPAKIAEFPLHKIWTSDAHLRYITFSRTSQLLILHGMNTAIRLPTVQLACVDLNGKQFWTQSIPGAQRFGYHWKMDEKDQIYYRDAAYDMRNAVKKKNDRTEPNEGLRTALSLASEYIGKSYRLVIKDKTYHIFRREDNVLVGSIKSLSLGMMDQTLWIDFDAAEKNLALVVGDTDVLIVDPVSGAVRRRLEGSRSTIGAIALSSDGRRLAAVNADRKLSIWNVETGREIIDLELGLLPAERYILSFYNKDSLLIITTSRGRQLMVRAR